MLQCTSEIEKAQPQFWPTLENKKVGGGWPRGGGGGGSESCNNPTKASKMDIHFPNLLDTIEVEDQDNNNTTGEIGSPTLSSVSPLLISKATSKAVGPKGNAAASSFAGLLNGGGVAPSKRAPKKKQQMLLFSTDMNFNRN